VTRSARTSLILLALAAVLLGYILLVERGSVSSGEREQRKGNALPEFVRSAVRKLEVQRKGELTVLVRDADDKGEGGLWRVEAPYTARADQDVVNTLLGALETIDTRRRIDKVTAEDRKRFGFDSPRYRVWFTRGKLRVPLIVGGESPQADGVYVQSSDASVAFVVAKDLVPDLERDANDYHAKELHEGVLVSTAVAVGWRDADGARSVRKRDDGLWSLEPATSGLASLPAIEETINALDALRAKRFVAAKVTDAPRYGLDAPRLELEVRNMKYVDASAKPAPGAKPERHEVGTKLLVGSACDGHPGESYVRMEGGDGVHCALDADLAKLHKPLADLREARLLPFEDDAVQDLELTHGSRRLELKKNGESFTYTAWRGGAKVLEGAARDGSVSEWLKALRDTRATRFDAGDLGIVAQSELIVLKVARGAGKPPWETHLRVSSSELLAQRPGEANALAFPSGAIDVLEPEAARFRSLRALQLAESSLQALELRREREIEHMVRAGQGSGYALDAPLHAPADPITVAELTRTLGDLTAVRFASDEALPAYGLASPALMLSLTRMPAAGAGAPAPLTLRIGAPAPGGGSYAQFEGERGVFVLADAIVRILGERLVSRMLLATPLERIAALQLEAGGRELRVKRDGERFTLTGSGAQVPAASAQVMAQAVATLRAARVASYGAPASEHGFAKPFARLVVTEVDGSTHVLTFGADAGDGARYARRDAEPVTFVLPKASVSQLVPTSSSSAR
jgi:hypothetical protein